MDRKSLLGAALMLVGIVLFVPGIQPTSGGLSVITLLAGTLLLTAGTYLVGTSEGGRPV